MIEYQHKKDNNDITQGRIWYIFAQTKSNGMKRLSILIVLIVLSLPAHAQLTLDQCQEKARKNYPEVAQYDLTNFAEEFNLKSAANGWIPQIVVSGQATWQSATAEFPTQMRSLISGMGLDMQGIPKDQYRIAIDISQTLYDGGSSKAKRELAKAEATEQRLSSDVSIFGVEQKVNELFFGILLLEENLKTLKGSETLLKANEQILASLIREGLSLESDKALIRAERLSLQQKIAQTESSKEAFASMLELFIGEPLNGRDLVKPQRIAVLGDSKRPELSLIDARIATLLSQEALLNSSMVPHISFFAQGFYGNPGLDMFKAMTTREWTWNAYLGVRMQWNLSSFFTHKNDIRKIALTRSSLEVQRDLFNFNSALQSESQNRDILRMEESLEQDAEIVSLRVLIREAAQSQLNNGVIDTATLLQRITEENDAKISMSIHEIELLKTQYELKHTLNQ